MSLLYVDPSYHMANDWFKPIDLQDAAHYSFQIVNLSFNMLFYPANKNDLIIDQ